METPIPEDHPDSRKYKNAPHPYIIIPPLTRRQCFEIGEAIFFDVVLIGKASEYLPYFIYAFTEMGRLGIGKGKGNFDLISVQTLDLKGSETEIFNGTKLLTSLENRIDCKSFRDEKFQGEEITLSFETPVRIKVNERLSSDIPFELLIRRLSERVFLLAHFHCGAELADFGKFAEGSEKVQIMKNKLRWQDWERYSSRQQTRMKFGGWIGEITYQGDFQRFLPLLRLGEHIHVGKVTTFGLGKYRIVDL
jgi:hypothetical protein